MVVAFGRLELRPQARPPARTVAFSSSQIYNENEKVIACWEDAQYSFNLFRSSYEPTFGMVAFSKRLDVLAGAAVAKAIRQDEQEAPERLKQQAEQSRIAQEKSPELEQDWLSPLTLRRRPMNVLDFAPTTATECTTSSFSKPDFTRAQFSRNGRVHAESRCNHCGFRITATPTDSFDNEEQEHARACRGSEAE
ncbi:MAG: hypothetical protein LAO06_14920 [Acidobacteriia bacterium]|nr:hypothetical protein [Terriglobia bacterium]